MKNKLKLLFLLLVSAFMLPAFVSTPSVDAPPVAKPKIKMPKKVNAAIQSKCYGCHSKDGKNKRSGKN